MKFSQFKGLFLEENQIFPKKKKKKYWFINLGPTDKILPQTASTATGRLVARATTLDGQ